VTANGAFQLLMMLFMAAMLWLIFNVNDGTGQPKPPIELMGFIFGLVFLFQIVFTAPSFVAAYALLKRKSWARLASIIAAAIAAMNVPIGTAACVYSLWFFLGDEWKSVYQKDEAFAGHDNRQIAHGEESSWDVHRMDEKGEVVYRHHGPPDWR